MAENPRRVSVIGLGYVGLPTAAVLASRGVAVLGIDVNPRAVEMINAGKVHIVEPDLDILVQGAVATGRLRAATTPEPADAFIIAVPTPFRDGHKADLSYLRDAAQNIAPVLKAGDLVILESTSPVGTTEELSRWLAAARPDLRFPHDAGERASVNVAHSPERVLPGRVLLEIVSNDRVVGGLSATCTRRAAAFYRLFVAGEIVETGARTAELCKLAENSFRDVNIAFANELSLVCERLGIDVWKVIALANRHPRVSILQPGPGVGGHCIAVDPWFIVESAPEETPLIQAARRVNDAKPGRVVARALQAAGKGATVAALGLSYKADIDDLRESPAVAIVAALAERLSGEILVVEPHVSALPPPLAGKPRVRLVDLDAALVKAEVVLLLVDHKPFKAIDRRLLAGKAIIDTRGIWR